MQVFSSVAIHRTGRWGSKQDSRARVADPGYGAPPERAFVFELSAWDRNCSQHITPRFTEGEIDAVVVPLKQRIEVLEAELATLRAESLSPPAP